MRIIYADAGLSSEIGHHANSCRAIVAALRERGHDVEVVAHREIDAALAQELGARPHFRLSTYWANDGDPVCGWLSGFFTVARTMAEDLAQLGPFGPDHLLYVNSIMPGQLMALRSFLLDLPEHARPAVCAEFGTNPGLDHVEDAAGARYVARDTRIDARATLYRFAAMQIAAVPLPQLHLCTFDRTSSELYALLIGRNVHTLPVPRFAEVAARRRGAARPLTIGVLGHQRGEKGYHLVPAVVELLLRVRQDICFLVHNGQPAFMAAVQEQMRALAARDARIILDERPAGPELWETLLDRCDLMLCPYDPASFRAAYSAVASEAIAHAIPLVAPAQTTLARVIEEFGSPGVTFADYTSPAIAVAVNDALEQFDHLAVRAEAAARHWRATMGAGAMVDTLLALTTGGDMMARLMQRSRPAAPTLVAKVA